MSSRMGWLRSECGVTSLQSGAEEIGDGEDLSATGAFTSETHLAAQEITVAASSLAEEAFRARLTLVDSLVGEALLPTQCCG
jgi:hypothetical protein